MSINNFIPGSSLFRKHLEITAIKDDSYHFFLTQTLKPEFCFGKTVNEQFKESITEILKKVGIFDFAHIVTELHNNGNVHYHILLSIKKENAHNRYYKHNITYVDDVAGTKPIMVPAYENILECFKFQYNNIKTNDIFNFDENASDFRAFHLTSSFLDYLHKDIDRLYMCANGWKVIKFIIYSKFTQLQNLQSLIHFKHK